MMTRRNRRNRRGAFSERIAAVSRHEILGSLFGGKSKSTTETTENRTENRISSGTRATEQEEAQSSITELLSEDIRSVLENLVTQIGTSEDTAAAGVGGIADMLLERAMGAEEAIGSQTNALIDRARFEGTRQAQSLTAQLARQAGAGPGSNSFVAGATAEALTGLEVALAGLEAETNLNTRTAVSQEFAGVADLFTAQAGTQAAETQALAALANVLRGSRAETQQTGTASTSENFTAEELLTALITSNSETRGKSRDPILKTLSGFF